MFVPSEKAIEKWPTKILSFLEEKIKFKMPDARGQNLLTEINKDSVDGVPASVLAATDVNGQLKYMCLWPNGFARKLISGIDHPAIVIAYMQSKIDFNIENENNTESFRGKKMFCPLHGCTK